MKSMYEVVGLSRVYNLKLLPIGPVVNSSETHVCILAEGNVNCANIVIHSHLDELQINRRPSAIKWLQHYRQRRSVDLAGYLPMTI